MRKTFLIFAILGLLLPQIVSADIILPGEKSVSYCFQIENIFEYPDYAFYLELPLSVDSERITQGECKTFYKFERPRIYAIAPGGKAIYSNLEISSVYMVAENDPVDAVQDIFVVNGITDESLNLTKDRVIYTYEDGSKEIVSY